MRSFSITSSCGFVEARPLAILLALVTLILFVGGAYSLYLGNQIRYPDEHEYLSMAVNLAEHGVFSLDGEHPTAWRPPGYPAILAALTSVGLGVFSMRMLNFTALAVSALLLYRLMKPLSVVAALVGAALAVAYPVFVYTAGTLYPQTVASTLFLAAVYLFFGRDPPSQGEAGLAGLVMGVLILTVPSFAFALLFLAAWLLARSRRFVNHAILLIFGCSLVLAPWLVRNYIRFGSFVFVSSNSGRNLLLGNSEDARPNSGTNVDITRYVAAAAGLGEIERDRFYRDRAVEFMRKNPGRTAQLYLLKFLNYFNYRNELFVKTETSPLRDAIALLSFGPLLAMALLRVILARRWPLSRLEHFALVLYVLNGAYAAVFFTRLRFRVPFDYLLLILVAMTVARLGSRGISAKPEPGLP